MAAVEVFTLVSNDGQKFEVSRSIVDQIGLLREMLEVVKQNNDDIPIHDICGRHLGLILEFCKLHEGQPEYVPYKRSAIPYQRDERHSELFKNLTSEDRASMINYSAYLQLPRLYDAIMGEVAHVCENKTVKELRQLLNIVNDFTPEEEERNRRDFPWYDE